MVTCSQKRVTKRNAGTLTAILLEHISPESIIYSDQWRGYSLVSDYFDHYQVNHSENFVNPVDGTNTQKNRGIVACLKEFPW